MILPNPITVAVCLPRRPDPVAASADWRADQRWIIPAAASGTCPSYSYPRSTAAAEFKKKKRQRLYRAAPPPGARDEQTAGHANLRSTVGTPSLRSIFRQLNFSISSKFPCPSLVLFFFLQFPIYFPRLTAFFFLLHSTS